MGTVQMLSLFPLLLLLQRRTRLIKDLGCDDGRCIIPFLGKWRREEGDSAHRTLDEQRPRTNQRDFQSIMSVAILCSSLQMRSFCLETNRMRLNTCFGCCIFGVLNKIISNTNIQNGH